jgi:hypothetical protein
MQTRCGRIELRKPANRLRTEASQSKEFDHGAAAGNPPVRVTPFNSSAGIESQALIDGTIPDVSEINPYWRPRASASTALSRHVDGRKRVAEEVRFHLDCGASTDNGPAALKFVYRQIHPLAIQRTEGPLDPVLAHQPLQVPILAARESQELAIRACGVCVNGLAGEGHEVALTLLETAA